ncbi:MAG: DUF3536 domain-containing protein [Candidatus Eisenbacteria bacterium]
MAGSWRPIGRADRGTADTGTRWRTATTTRSFRSAIPDRQTQIRWGMADFRFRFGRDAEGFWLPETAADPQTLGALIDAGLAFVVLSPYQAARVREDGRRNWSAVPDATIDPGRPYRFLHPDGSGRSLSVFFYDAVFSQAIAFDGGVSSSQVLVEHVRRAAERTSGLIHAATDGETYGHHGRFGDLALAYALESALGPLGYRFVNYGEYLEAHPPTATVELEAGEDGLGTSWSCPHGVARWFRHCGCAGGGREGSQQAWREPLRAALDTLRDHAAGVFESTAAALLTDPWAARDDYVWVLLSRNARPLVGPSGMVPTPPPLVDADAFFARHARRSPSRRDRTHLLTLLELQRHALLMYTSCGWFWDDVARGETMQVLRYAGRVLDLLDDAGLPAPRDVFLDLLSAARSNDPKQGNGADLFRTEAMASRVTPQRMVAQIAFDRLSEQDERPAGSFEVIRHRSHRGRVGRTSYLMGRLALRSRTTERGLDAAYCAFHLGGLDVYCGVREHRGDRFREAVQRVRRVFAEAALPGILRVAEEEFGPIEFTAFDLLPDSRERVGGLVFSDLVARFREEYRHLYEEHRHLIEPIQAAGFPLPPELRVAAEITLGRRFEEEVARHRGRRDPAAYTRALAIAEEVDRRGYRIHSPRAAALLGDMVDEAIRAGITGGEEEVAAALRLLELVHRLGVTVRMERTQEIVYQTVRSDPAIGPRLRPLADPLGLSPQLFEPDPLGPGGGIE